MDNAHGVKVGRFCSPGLDVFKTEFYGSTIAREARVKESVNNILLCNFLTLGIKHLYSEILLLIVVSLNRVKAHFHLHCSILVIRRELRSNIMVAHAYRRHIIYIDIAEDTRHAEHVLTFQVRTVAPTEYFYRKSVLNALLQELGDVKLRNIICALSVTNIFSVDPHICSRVNTAEV